MVCNGNHCWIPAPVSWCVCVCVCVCACAYMHVCVCVCAQTRGKCNLAPYLLPWYRCESPSSPGLAVCWEGPAGLLDKGWLTRDGGCESQTGTAASVDSRRNRLRREWGDDQWIMRARVAESSASPGVLSVSLAELFFIVSCCPVPCGIFGNMPGLHLNIPPWESHDNQNCPWLSPGGEITPAESHRTSHFGSQLYHLRNGHTWPPWGREIGLDLHCPMHWSQATCGLNTWMWPVWDVLHPWNTGWIFKI